MFVLTRISGEPRTAIIHRNLYNWTERQEFLQNSYIEKRTLDYNASQLFMARPYLISNIYREPSEALKTTRKEGTTQHEQ
jgi:hypothetical protein